MSKKPNSKLNLIYYSLASIGLIIAMLSLLVIHKSNFKVTNNEKKYVYVPTNSGYNDLLNNLKSQKLLKNELSFKLAARILGLSSQMKAGRYLVTSKTSNYKLISDIKKGNQSLVRLTLDNIQTKTQLAKLLSSNLEINYNSAVSSLYNNQLAKQYSLTVDSLPCLFIANTYFLPWNTSMKNFLKFMQDRYKKYWNEERINKAKSLNLTPEEIYILASIVYKEVRKNDEMPMVAGLYLNRLKKGMPLAADPTIIFANNAFGVKRVRYRHLRIKSPYNTYLNKGLPPGPISLVPISALEAVLNYTKHNYLYMCAKSDLSGRHNFAETFKQHQKNASALRKQLNRLNIK